MHFGPGLPLGGAGAARIDREDEQLFELLQLRSTVRRADLLTRPGVTVTFDPLNVIGSTNAL